MNEKTKWRLNHVESRAPSAVFVRNRLSGVVGTLQYIGFKYVSESQRRVTSNENRVRYRIEQNLTGHFFKEQP